MSKAELYLILTTVWLTPVLLAETPLMSFITGAGMFGSAGMYFYYKLRE